MHAASRRLQVKSLDGWPLIVDVLKFAALAAVLTVVMIRATEDLGYHWQWYRVPRYLLSVSGRHLDTRPAAEAASS